MTFGGKERKIGSMENQKLKKLGKYFTKGLQAGVLATALMLGTAGCGNNAGGSTVEEEYHPTPDKDHTQEETKTLKDMTADEIRAQYNISDYSGIAFAPDNIDFARTDDQAKGPQLYNDAKIIMDKMVAELQNDLDNEYENEYIALMKQNLANSRNQNNNTTYVGDDVKNNYEAYANIMYPLRDSLVDDKDFFAFNACYEYLAVDAYKKSLGNYKNSKDFDTDLTKSSIFDSHLSRTDLTYDAMNGDFVRDKMDNLLSTIGETTNVNPALIKKTIELALYNESLHGLHDTAAKVGNIGLGSQRNYNYQALAGKYGCFEIHEFIAYINEVEYHQVQQIDDRTM